MTMPALKTKFQKEVLPKLLKELGYKNVHQCPRLKKVVLNVGMGAAATTGNTKLMDSIANELAVISGQRAVVTKAKKAVSNFKIRRGMNVGCMITLHGDMMYDFLYRLINFALPRIRDFRGIPDNSFDGRGNYTLGLKEQTIFPEIDYDKVEGVHGMDITVVTSAVDDKGAYELLKALGMPFRRKKDKQAS
jgi:large subunit ribosomal protein L5